MGNFQSNTVWNNINININTNIIIIIVTVNTINNLINNIRIDNPKESEIKFKLFFRVQCWFNILEEIDFFEALTAVL
jgi:outer membrane phospholipase A